MRVFIWSDSYPDYHTRLRAMADYITNNPQLGHSLQLRCKE